MAQSTTWVESLSRDELRVVSFRILNDAVKGVVYDYEVVAPLAYDELAFVTTVTSNGNSNLSVIEIDNLVPEESDCSSEICIWIDRQSSQLYFWAAELLEDSIWFEVVTQVSMQGVF